MLVCHLYIFFGEVSVKVFGPFVNQIAYFLLLTFKSSLDNSPLSDGTFVNIFSQFMACLLILLTLSFTEQKFLILMKSSLSIISFMDHAFAVVSKKSLNIPRLSRFPPMLSSRSFIVLCFTFRSLINFELIFVKGVMFVSRFIFFFLYEKEKTIISAPLYCLHSFIKDQLRASLVAQWLRVCLPVQGTRVRALVWEDPTCCGATGPVSHNN